MSPFEYTDRENQPGVIQLGSFSQINRENLFTLKPGDKFIAVSGGKDKERGLQGIDFNTKVHILFTLERVNGIHIKAEGFGSFAYDLCLKLEV